MSPHQRLQGRRLSFSINSVCCVSSGAAMVLRSRRRSVTGNCTSLRLHLLFLSRYLFSSVVLRWSRFTIQGFKENSCWLVSHSDAQCVYSAGGQRDTRPSLHPSLPSSLHPSLRLADYQAGAENSHKLVSVTPKCRRRRHNLHFFLVVVEAGLGRCVQGLQDFTDASSSSSSSHSFLFILFFGHITR